MKDGKITFKELYGGQGLELSRTGPYEGKFSYPIVEVPSLDVRFSSHPGKPYPHCHLEVKATLLVRDAVDDERFLYDVNDVFDFDAMEEEDDSGEGLIRRVGEFDNLVVTRTFSKAYALAAMRVGYMASNRKLADMMASVKIPYSLNAVSEGAAIAAVHDQDFIRRSVDMVRQERPKLEAGLRKLGFEPFPSDSNFILARSPIDHTALVEGLKKKGVLIRDFGSKRRTENCVRPTVGTEELNRLLLEKTAEVIDECS